MATSSGSVQVDVGVNLGRFEAGMRTVEGRLGRLSTLGGNVGRSFGVLGRSADSAGRSLGRVTRGASSAILSFVGLRGAVLAASGGFLGGAGLVYAMQKAVGVAINLEEQVNKVGVVFARSGGMIVNWSKKTSTGIGIAQVAALEAAGTFGNMLRPLGILPKQAANMSRSLVNLAGDMSSFNNASIEDTLLAIRAGLAGEVEPLRRFGVFLSETRLKAEAIGSGLVNKGFKGTLDPLVKSLAAYNLMIRDTKLTQGDYNRTADDTANVIRTVKAQVSDLAGIFGKGLLPVVNRVGRQLREKFADPQFQARVEAVGKLVGEKMLRAFERISSWFDKHWGEIAQGFRLGGEALAFAATAAGKLAQALKTIGENTPGGLGTLLGLGVAGKMLGGRGGKGKAGGLLFGLGPVGTVIGGGIVIGGAGIGRESNNVRKQRQVWDSYSAQKQHRIYQENPGKIEEWLGMIGGTLKQLPGPARSPDSSIRGGGPVTAVPGKRSRRGGGPSPITTDRPLQTSESKARAKTKRSRVQELLPANLRLGLAAAEVTAGTGDDIRAWTAIERWLEQRVRVTRNVNRKIELLQELASARSHLAGFREAAAPTARLSTLFGGPFLSGEAFQTASSFGYQAKPRDLLRDIRAQNVQLGGYAESLSRLKQRGAPTALIEEIRGMGLEGADEAALLARMGKGQFRQFVKAFGTRERLEERIQHVAVNADSATINIGNATINTGNPGTRGTAGGFQARARTIGARRGR